LDIALESTEHAISLVADMLDVSRIETGRIEINPEKLDAGKNQLLWLRNAKKASDKKNHSNFRPSRKSIIKAG